MSVAQVFFLDDDPDLRFAYQYFLETNGYSVITAGSVPEMQELGEGVLHTDIAFLDVELGAGQSSGLDALEWLVSHHYKGKPVFLTAHGNGHPLIAKARLQSSVELLSKPVRPERLLERVNGGSKCGSKCGSE